MQQRKEGYDIVVKRGYIYLQRRKEKDAAERKTPETDK